MSCVAGGMSDRSSTQRTGPPSSVVRTATNRGRREDAHEETLKAIDACLARPDASYATQEGLFIDVAVELGRPYGDHKTVTVALMQWMTRRGYEWPTRGRWDAGAPERWRAFLKAYRARASRGRG